MCELIEHLFDYFYFVVTYTRYTVGYKVGRVNPSTDLDKIKVSQILIMNTIIQ